jgi:hypothetical protein
VLALEPEGEMFPYLTDGRKLQLVPEEEDGADVEREESGGSTLITFTMPN